MVKNAGYLLLQVNDALFPIGGYSHSYGLETYIQKGIVKDVKSAAEFIHKKLTYNFCYNELLNVRLAWEYAAAADLEKLQELEEIVEAGKTPREIREASRKLGSRFVKTLDGLKLEFESSIYTEFIKFRKGKSMHHATVYGVFCAALGIAQKDCLEHFIYAQTSAMVTNCVKTIPLSQSSGQQLLAETYEVFQELLNKVMELDADMLGLSAPGFDLRCMQHEGLYSRIYMS
ncbi:MAG: urease accessory protein UreF [Muricoprocola sp.]